MLKNGVIHSSVIHFKSANDALFASSKMIYIWKLLFKTKKETFLNIFKTNSVFLLRLFFINSEQT